MTDPREEELKKLVEYMYKYMEEPHRKFLTNNEMQSLLHYRCLLLEHQVSKLQERIAKLEGVK